MRIKLTDDSIAYLREKRIYFEVRLEESRLKPGDHLDFTDHTTVEPYCAVLSGFRIPKMGAFSYSWSVIHPDMVIGRYCSIARGLQIPWPRHPIEKISSSSIMYDRNLSFVQQAIIDSGFDYKNFVRNTQKPMPVLGNDVWIGADVALMPGITIGSGAVVASNSVVTKDVDPYSIVGGNPAKHIKFRFEEDVVAALLKAEWWQYKFTDFASMNLDDPSVFLRELERDAREPYRPTPIKLADIPQ